MYEKCMSSPISGITTWLPLPPKLYRICSKSELEYQNYVNIRQCFWILVYPDEEPSPIQGSRASRLRRAPQVFEAVRVWVAKAEKKILRRVPVVPDTCQPNSLDKYSVCKSLKQRQENTLLEPDEEIHHHQDYSVLLRSILVLFM